jgi:transcriptional regulator with XRE-family HTH domain
MDITPSRPWHSLKYHRHRAEFSLEELAKRAGLSRSYVGFLESGDKPRTDTATLRLAKALGIDPSELRVDLGPAVIDADVFTRLETHLASIGEQLADLKLHVTKGAA